MDWREKGIEAIYLGVIAFLGSAFVKRFKPSLKGAKRMYGVIDEVDVLKKEVGVLKDLIQKILYTAPDPIFKVNNKGEVIFVNPAWLQMTGVRTEKDAFGFGFMKAIPEDDRDAMVDQSEMLTKHPSAFEGEIRFQHLVTDDIILTICRSEPVFYNGEHIETIGRLTIIKT